MEDNRFSDILEELERKAYSYGTALSNGTADAAEKKEEFRSLCQWHIRKSRYKSEKFDFINVDEEFFNGVEINRPALDNFEKEIIKAHMYQKYLWEFMGTTGNMTIISKTDMKKDGFCYDDYLPSEYKKNQIPKSPLSPVLQEHPDALPIYLYQDGSASNEYEQEKAVARFDVLQDRSGFDWSKKGWDPNYEVAKVGWCGTYNADGFWEMVRENKGAVKNELFPGARFADLPVIELIKDENGVILYDSGCSLLLPFERIYLLTNGEIYGAETKNTAATVALIKNAMDEAGIQKITGIVSENVNDDSKIQMQYKKLFGERCADTLEIKKRKDIAQLRKNAFASFEKKMAAEKGRELSARIDEAVKLGYTGERAVRVLETGEAEIPLSVFNKADCVQLGINGEKYAVLQHYDISADKRDLFNVIIINLIAEKSLLETSGKNMHDFFDAAYEYVVNGNKNNEIINVESTFENICKTHIILPSDEILHAEIVKKAEEVKALLPPQDGFEKQEAVNQAVDSAIKNFYAIRMSTGMTAEETVNFAAINAGGKGFFPQSETIIYKNKTDYGKNAFFP